MSNDQKIKDYRSKIEQKRQSLGERPKAHYETNGMFILPDNLKLNINVLSTVEACVDVVQQLLLKASTHKQANELLGTNVPCMFGVYTLEQCITDLKIRVSTIEWEAGKRKLDAMDKQLAELMSNDAKTADAIANIADELGL